MGTKLDAGWSGVFYPEAGELVAVGRLLEEQTTASGTIERRPVRVLDGRTAPLTRTAPEDQPADDRAGRRAKGAVRRYSVANRIVRLATLTRADQTTDVQLVLRDFARFARRLRGRYPTVAWVRVLERHQSGALHVHVGLSGYVPKEHLAALWGHGFVDVRRIRGRRGSVGEGREASRVTARYLAKYVVKDPVRDGAGHRYEVRQGFQPRAVRAAAWTVDELLDLFAVSDPPAYRWDSSSEAMWTGPPVAYLAMA